MVKLQFNYNVIVNFNKALNKRNNNNNIVKHNMLWICFGKTKKGNSKKNESDHFNPRNIHLRSVNTATVNVCKASFIVHSTIV